MLLTGDQKFFLSILRELGWLRLSQVLPLLRVHDPAKTAHQAQGVLRGLCYAGQAVAAGDLVCLPELRGIPPDPGKLLAVDVLLALKPRRLLQLSVRSGCDLCFLIQRGEQESWVDLFAVLSVPTGKEAAICRAVQAEPAPYVFLLVLEAPEQHSLLRLSREHFFVLRRGSALRFYKGGEAAYP